MLYSLKHKFFLIPVIAAACVSLFVISSFMSKSRDQTKLRNLKNKYAPLLSIADKNIIRLEQIQEMMKAAVTTEQAEFINEAFILSELFLNDLNKMAMIEPNQKSTCKLIEKDFKIFFEQIKTLTLNFIQSSATFEELMTKSAKTILIYNDLHDKLTILSENNYRVFSQVISDIETDTESLISFHITTGIITIILIIVCGYFITNTITVNIKRITREVKQMHIDNNNSITPINHSSKDEIGLLAITFNKAIHKFNDQLQQNIKRNKEIDNLNDHLSQKINEFTNLISKDDLTGLHNYSFFKEELIRQIQGYQKNKGNTHLSLMLIDPDNFKYLNKQCGHILGDTILREISARIMYLTTKKQMVCRYGGAKFAVILPGYNLTETKELAEQIRKYVEEVPIQHPKGNIKVTISIGCKEYASEELNIFIQATESVLNQAKLKGKNTVES